MFGFLFRSFWRVLIFAIGSLTIYIAIFDAYPYINSRLPAFVALLLLYSVFAYLIIPALIRLFQLVITPNHLPIYATSRDGWSSDPVNLAIVCNNKTELMHAMKKSGWHIADAVTIRSSIRIAYAILTRRSYPNAPFSSLYLFGRKQDVGFQIQPGNTPSPRHRHHMRLWRIEPQRSKDIHASFWRRALHPFEKKEKQLWVGAATHDISPFAFRIQNLQLTHKIDPDTNLERDFVIETLKKQKLVKKVETIQTGTPLSFRGQTFGVRITVDGQLKVIALK